MRIILSAQRLTKGNPQALQASDLLSPPQLPWLAFAVAGNATANAQQCDGAAAPRRMGVACWRGVRRGGRRAVGPSNGARPEGGGEGTGGVEVPRDMQVEHGAQPANTGGLMMGWGWE